MKNWAISLGISLLVCTHLFGAIDYSVFDYTEFQRDLLLKFNTDYAVPKTSLKGSTHIPLNLVFSHSGVECIKQFYDSSGGVISAYSVAFTDISSDVLFISNETQSSGGAIYTNQDCWITNNAAQISFIDNKAFSRSRNCYGGAIFCDGNGNFTLSNNRGQVCFGYNLARNEGGAVYAQKKCLILDNEAPIVFLNNNCVGGKGGAIRAYLAAIVGNKNPICFLSNRGGGAGAISATTSMTFSKNLASIFFSDNGALTAGDPAGGAIDCTDFVIDGNPGAIWFDENTCLHEGGAIRAKNFTIKGSGPITFSSNSAVWGGALLSSRNGSAYISADYGDIVFDNNIVSAGGSAVYRNAWHITPGISIKLGASKHYKIAFYDPLEWAHPITETVLFHPEPFHQGTILFSSKTLPYTLIAEKNYTSFLGNPVVIRNGFVTVRDGATIAVYQLEQENGYFCLGQGGILRTLTQNTTGSSVGCSVNLTKFALNLPSILSEGSRPPTLWMYPAAGGIMDPNPEIVISGDLTFLDDNNYDPYDSLDLSESKTRVALFHLSEWESKKVDVSNLNTEAVNAISHYGYQGKWTPYWEEYTVAASSTISPDANTHHRILYANWTPVGYIPNPKFQSRLPANVLWESTYLVCDQTENASLSNSKFGIFGSGEGSVIYQHNRSNAPGFHSKTLAYSAGTSVAFSETREFAFNFKEAFSRLKEETRNYIHSKNYVCSCHMKIGKEDRGIATLSTVYAYGVHQMVHKYPEDARQGQGQFYSHSYGLAFHLDFPKQRIDKALFVTPFVKVVGTRATFARFMETGDYIRDFSIRCPLYNVITPIGLESHLSTHGRYTSDWTYAISYQPTLFRNSQKLFTRLVASNGSWLLSGTSVARHAFGCRASHQISLLKRLQLILDYQGHFSSTTFRHHWGAKSQLSF